MILNEKPQIVPSELARRIFELANDERVRHELQELLWDENMAAISVGHSDDMVERDYFSHISPSGKEPGDRARCARYRCEFSSRYRLGENLARLWLHVGYRVEKDERIYGPWRSAESLAREAVDGWMNSPSHRRNMVARNYRYMAIGIAFADDGAVLVTQNFC